MLNESDLRGYIDSTTRVHKDLQPVNVSNLDSPPANENYYLDMSEAVSGAWRYYTAPDSARFNPYPETVYGTVRPCPCGTGEKAIQYWIFYPWNYWLNKHEGDWEMVQVWLDSNGVPKIATYFYHEWHYATWWWSDDLKLIGDTHPAAYIANGSHASYPFLDLGKTLIPDNVSKDGTILSHENTVSDLTGYPNNKSTYELVKIDDSTVWADFPGRWGYYDLPTLIGPTGPGTKNQWSRPQDYLTSNLPININLAKTGSPVNLHAYDSQGRHVGLNATGDVELEIPGTYAYEPSDNGTETMIILTDEELTYVVEATGEGEFNLTVDRGLQNVRYIADYYDVNITSNSMSNLEVSDANPEFIMEVDYDGDGTSDYVKYPDNLEIITYNQADIYATMFQRNFDQGDTLSSRIYVENSGQGAIDDILRISITDPYGEKVYRELKPIYIAPDEMESFKIGWTVPSDAPQGVYKLRVEFDDWDIDALPRVRWFDVG